MTPSRWTARSRAQRILGLPVLLLALLAPAAGANAAHFVVLNCADSGTGSLRAVLPFVSDGDTVDLRQLDCVTIKLESALEVTVDNLTILGRLVSFPPLWSDMPVPFIDGQDQTMALLHTGTGKLTLDRVSVTRGFTQGVPGFGFTARGGCIRSSGSVTIRDSGVSGCRARYVGTNAAGAQGGAIWAAGLVNVLRSQILDNEAYARYGGARGGAIDGGEVLIQQDSIVSGNTARTDSTAPGVTNAGAIGGAIYAATVLKVQSSTLRNNHAISAGTAGEARGGAIFVIDANGDSLINASVIEGNGIDGPASSCGGGAIYAEGRKLVVTYSRINDNTAFVGSAGVCGYMKNLQVRYSTLDGNVSTGGAAAIHSQGTGSGSETQIERSTISNNVSHYSAAVSLASPIVRVHQSTISGNQSYNSLYGAGVRVSGTSNQFIHNTITGNIERSPDNTPYGAGINLFGSGTTAWLECNIVSGNRLSTGTTGITSDIGTTFTSGSPGGIDGLATRPNVIGASSITVPHAVIATNPRLKALADNGGRTLTHMPNIGSPALDLCEPSVFPAWTVDQRGLAYPIGPKADAGSVERDPDRIFYNGFQ